MASLACGPWHRAGGGVAPRTALFMVSAGRIGGFAKSSFEFMALGSDTTNAATKFGCDAVVDRCGTTRLRGADRRHVSCSGISVVGVCRGYIFDSREVSTKQRTTNDGRPGLSGSVLLTADQFRDSSKLNRQIESDLIKLTPQVSCLPGPAIPCPV